jgi:hypothetical protein
MNVPAVINLKLRCGKEVLMSRIGEACEVVSE